MFLKKGWLRVLRVPCPTCGAKSHSPCVEVTPPHRPLSVTNPHFARILHCDEKLAQRESL